MGERRRLAQMRDEIVKLRDEVRVRSHLLELDAKREWNELDERLRQLEEQIAGSDEHAVRSKLAEMLNAARSFVERKVNRSGPPAPPAP